VSPHGSATFFAETALRFHSSGLVRASRETGGPSRMPGALPLGSPRGARLRRCPSTPPNEDENIGVPAAAGKGSIGVPAAAGNGSIGVPAAAEDSVPSGRWELAA
jgi:hypothetical protein